MAQQRKEEQMQRPKKEKTLKSDPYLSENILKSREKCNQTYMNHFYIK